MNKDTEITLYQYKTVQYPTIMETILQLPITLFTLAVNFVYNTIYTVLSVKRTLTQIYSDCRYSAEYAQLRDTGGGCYVYCEKQHRGNRGLSLHNSYYTTVY